MNFTGERFFPGVTGDIEAEHFHRYLLAYKLAAGRDVLDIACGEGYGSNLLAGIARSVVGVDVSIETIAHAKSTYQAPNLTYIQGDCSRIPIENESVDLVVSFETIEHHAKHVEMLSEFHRILRPGGIVIISSPNRFEYNKTLSEPNKYHVKELDFNEFADLLKASFPTVEFYAQRVLSGSVIVPYQQESSGFSYFTGMSAENTSGELDRPIYFIAVASDSRLPALGFSIYETGVVNTDVNINARFLEARLYLSGIVNGFPQLYSESNSVGQVFEVDGARKTMKLRIPLDLQPLARVRLDISNAPVVIELHSMSMYDNDSKEIWRWDLNIDQFVKLSGLLRLPSDDSVMFICIDGDPQFEISFPSEILARIRSGTSISYDFTSHRLLDHLNYIFEYTRRQIVSSSIEEDIVCTPHRTKPLKLAASLDLLRELLNTKLSQRDTEIAQQSTQLRRLREELIRAESQLELLKDLMLQSHDEHRL